MNVLSLQPTPVEVKIASIVGFEHGLCFILGVSRWDWSKQ
jgi:hypothetical protein